jgi:hypothetical protein
MTPTAVYDTFWRFAYERQAAYLRRLAGEPGPWTADPVLSAHRFTNVFRASDRVSQYLIREVQYRPDRSGAPDEVFFRTMLFKLFNKVGTWEMLERELGPLSWQAVELGAITGLLDRAFVQGERIYSAAYIMPNPAFGNLRKHANHIGLLARMMDDRLAGRLQRAGSLAEVYHALLEYPGMGPFLAFQHAIDLNYSTLLDFDEGDFVVAGPGALDGISKCFSNVGGLTAAQVIMEMAVRQEAEFKRLGLEFGGLFGRRMQPIDVQNVFCEISKYARVAHPEIAGVSDRTRIKQVFRHAARQALPTPMFPPRWHLQVPSIARAP